MKTHREHKSTLVVAAGVILNVFLAGWVQTATAELREINDTELGNVVGQAVMAFDISETGTTKQTKFTMGMDIETQVNFNQVTIGEYDKINASTNADIDIKNLSLGHISDGKIVPFEAVNPYFEISESGGELVGFRMGFEQARGTLSGDLNSFSGNLGLKIVDDAGVEHEGTLLDDQFNSTNNRATHIGMVIVPPAVTQPGALTEQQAGPAATSDPTFPQDPQLAADLAPPPVPEEPPRLIVNKLTNFKTLDVGEVDASGAEQFTKDFFFSFQKKEVVWQGIGGGDAITAGPGIHLNIPTTLKLSIPQFEAGLSRARSEYIDRGVGLF